MLDQRGLEGNGWSSAWKTSAWARLGNAQKAMDNFAFAIKTYTTDSLFSICSKAMQVDGAFGFTAAIAEMLDYDGPVIFDCIVDKTENCFPMIPSGKAHNEMLLNDLSDDAGVDIGSVIDAKGKALV